MKTSIIIRAYNAESTITRAIESVLKQGFEGEYELIIVDDGSTDRTAQVLAGYAQDARVRILHQENRGAVQASNVGIRAARGPIIMFLDADDELTPESLSAGIEAMSDTSIAYAFGDYYEESGGVTARVRPANPFEALMGAFVWRREYLLQAGGFDGATIFPEYDMLLRARATWRGTYIPQPLFLYHRRKESITGNIESVRASLDVLRRKYPELTGEIAAIRSYAL
jgi:glycosyltransferase involved in cell wall biosynthesis